MTSRTKPRDRSRRSRTAEHRRSPCSQVSRQRNNWSQLAVALALLLFTHLIGCRDTATTTSQPAREEVVFWHFWGGRDSPLVEQIVADFNASQDRYQVRAIAMPGNNLDLKFFLSVAGGDPPDLLNHDDPVVADWAHRGVLTPLSELARPAEIERLKTWLFPAARELGQYDGQLYALCNGLDIRALYCNQTLLDEQELPLPRTIADLDHIADTIAPLGQQDYQRMGFLPDARRLWAWGASFGGRFWDSRVTDANDQITCDAPPIVAALDWMAGYSRRYGPTQVAAFRSGEQALTGAAFPMLANRRYAVAMDGQWRVRDLAAAAADAQRRDIPFDQFAVVPLPPPPGGAPRAGWVNGNFFVVPQAAKCKAGAWEFMQFWTGYHGNEARAATYCARGGWIPASQQVVEQASYQQTLAENPLLSVFVELAGSENQQPTPALPVAAYYTQQVNQAAQEVLYKDASADPRKLLEDAASRVRIRLREVRNEP